jgi:hypothetical protein
VEKPFPVEVVKKLEIPVPKPYPVHVIYYKHISEDDPPPKGAKGATFGSQLNKYNNGEYGGEFAARVHHDKFPFRGF